MSVNKPVQEQVNEAVDNNSVRPPLGIIPEWRFRELRIDEIRIAIKRYEEANFKIPAEWIDEMSNHLQWLRDYLPTSPLLTQSNQVNEATSVTDKGEQGESGCNSIIELLKQDFKGNADYHSENL